MPRFDIKDHDKRMGEILRPPKRKIPLMDRLRGRLRRPPRLPEL